MDAVEIFAKRLKIAREQKGWSMEDAARQLGLTKQSISKYESAQMLPNSKTLINFINAFGVSLDYFFRPFTITIKNVEFRKKAKLSAKTQKSIQAIVTEKLEHYVEVENLMTAKNDFVNPIRMESKATNDSIPKCVEEIREAWNIGECIPDVIDMLETHNVKVIEIPNTDGFDGLCGLADNQPFVVVAGKWNAERKRFTALHELGHILLPIDDANADKEKLCHTFASEMLIPNKIFEKYAETFNKKVIVINELKKMQKLYGISVDALMYKAKECGFLTENNIKSFCIKKNRFPKFKEYVESTLTTEEHPMRFESMVNKAYAMGVISKDKATELLGEEIWEIPELVIC